MSGVISSFKGEYAFLSNFYHTQSPLVYSGCEFPTGEHMFQAMKTADFREADLVAAAPSPYEAKRLGSQVTLVSNWHSIKRFKAMRTVLWTKFVMSNPLLGNLLCQTGDMELIEGNTWHDNTWGDCQCDKCEDIEGENYLGRYLMDLRSTIRSWDSYEF